MTGVHPHAYLGAVLLVASVGILEPWRPLSRGSSNQSQCPGCVGVCDPDEVDEFLTVHSFG